MRYSNILASITLLFCSNNMSYAEKPPTAVTSAIIVKILQFEKSVNSSGEIKLYIIGAPEVAAELKKVIGKKVGDLTLKSVESGDKLPSSKPSAIFNDDAGLAESVSKYTKSNKIASITRNNTISTDGITILIELTPDGKPLISINPTASKVQDLDWNPAVFKIAKKLE